MKSSVIHNVSLSIQNTFPPFECIYDGLFFPISCAKAVVVPVPLDYGISEYAHIEDLRFLTWITLGHAVTSRNQHAGVTVRYSEPVVIRTKGSDNKLWLFMKTASDNDFLNTLLAAPNDGGSPVYSDVLFVKESGGRLVDLVQDDVPYVVQTFRSWWNVWGPECVAGL
ncbi:hypothetical protein B0H17DRAFT_1200649 [Mycena rosella]|uniref:Uncharacterized protein n=1 Tax=Mycena rosella TaxID=1033263 RepID=A0AAD7DK36_MYCRO|nr:hypothetical protein B0H17DRAFT_1200649 [Mycena rosella]